MAMAGQRDALEKPDRSKWKPYPEYRDSRIEWLGQVPLHWDVKRLKHISAVRSSSVDKHTNEGEVPVRLCNYTDVYYNECMTDDLPLMAASATSEEIGRFALSPGDVVVTKDSESWQDIAVPAYVASSDPDVVCGYHLAIVRPRTSESDGRFLLRCFHAPAVNHQFRIAACGITRYGFRHRDQIDRRAATSGD